MTTKSQEAFESSRTKRMDFTHDGYSYHSSETQTEFEKFEDGYDIGCKQALEEVLALANDPITNYCNSDFYEFEQAIKGLMK